MPLQPLRNIHPAYKTQYETLAIFRNYRVIVENLKTGNIQERIISDLEKYLITTKKRIRLDPTRVYLPKD